MPSVVERSEIFLLADDTNAWQNYSIDVLQRDLKALQNGLTNKKTLEKQKSVLVDSNNKRASRCCIELNGETLMSQACPKNLCVFVNNDLKFVDHLQKVKVFLSGQRRLVSKMR